jgi:hypothetical protein
MRFGWFLAGSAALVLATGWLLGQQDTQFFSINDVRPGLKGVGRTVFDGDKIEEFQVDIRGVLRNVLAPKHDVVLAHLSGAGLEKTGVVAGMSGSPVYVDGKLLGAVAVAFPFSKDSYALITPIQDMLEVVPDERERNTKSDSSVAAEASLTPWRIARVGGVAGSERLIPEDGAGPAAWARQLATPRTAGPLADVRLPLRFGGFSSEAIDAATPLFREMGLEPVGDVVLSGGSSLQASQGSGANVRADAADLAPGSMISLLFVRGDLNLNADCTVTYRRQNSVYACGHQVFLTGPAQIPFAKSHVLATIPSVATSFKVDSPGPLVGTIHQDRFGAITAY